MEILGPVNGVTDAPPKGYVDASLVGTKGTLARRLNYRLGDATLGKHIHLVGDSNVEFVGSGGTTRFEGMVGRLQSRLRSSYGTFPRAWPAGYFSTSTGLEGIVGAAPGSPWTRTGSPTTQTDFPGNSGPGLRSILLANATQYVETSAVVCDRYYVLYRQIPSGATIQVAHGDPVANIATFSTANATTKGSRVYDSGALTLASRKVRLTPTTTANAYIEGIFFMQGGTTNVYVWEGGHSGATAYNYLHSGNGGTGALNYFTDLYDGTQPWGYFDHTILMFGSNEMGPNAAPARTAAETAADYTNLVAAIRAKHADAEITMVVSPAPNADTAATQAEYAEAVSVAAAATSCGFLDLGRRMGIMEGTSTASAPAGSPFVAAPLTTDETHYTPRGHEWVSRHLLDNLVDDSGERSIVQLTEWDQKTTLAAATPALNQYSPLVIDGDGKVTAAPMRPGVVPMWTTFGTNFMGTSRMEYDACTFLASDANVVFASPPATVREFKNPSPAGKYQRRIGTQWAGQYRLEVYVAVAAASARVGIQYLDQTGTPTWRYMTATLSSTGGGSTPGSVTTPEIDCSTTGPKNSGWITMANPGPALASDVDVRLVELGNAAGSPAITHARLMLRPA
ncbi:MAG TPA: SGNH/GDSL hydrolase family protein [Aquihabitans sp.]|jgi:hypothetical protein|nr:SGNH/GDSL hydrolase family protein [Aquihabitans sp.]